ncbi:MAG: potassium transporter TrkG [Desulfurococcaceae archaeon]
MLIRSNTKEQLLSMGKAICSLNLIIGLLMLFTFLYDLITGNTKTQAFTITSVILIIIGILSLRIRAKPLGLMSSLVTASLAWIMFSTVSAIPLTITLNISFLDALFESVSGFTGTGLTVLTNLTSIPQTILLWRSVMQWSGELGIVVFAMVLFPFFYSIGAGIYGIERPMKIETSFYKTAWRIFILYSIITIVGFIFFIYTGMNAFEAINHVMTTVATGGMSTYDRGYEVIFERAPQTIVPVLIFMVIGSINFILLDRAFRGDYKAVIKNDEFKIYVSLLLFSSILASLCYMLLEAKSPVESVLYGFFNTISGVTTTGFNLGSMSNLHNITKFILIIGMFIGGMTFATTGGIKAYRFLILVKKMKMSSLSLITTGRFEKYVKINNSIISESEVALTLLFVIIHATAIAIGATIISSYGYDYIDSLFEATSAASCVGLSTGLTGPYSPIGIKITLIVLMLLGKLEYVQLFLIIGFIGGRKILKTIR